jgi:hypothetical protein
VCIAAAVLSNFSACFAFAVQSVVFMRSSVPRTRAVARWAAVTAVLLVLTSPWIYRVTTFVDFGRLVTPVQPGELGEVERLRGDTTFRFESVPYTFYAYSVGFALGPTLAEMHGDVHAAVARNILPVAWTGLLFGALAVLGLLRAARPRGGGGAWRAWELVLYIAVPLAATMLLNWQNAKAFNVRYVLVGLPMFLTLVAVGIEGAGRARRSMIAGLLALGTCALALFNYYTDAGRHKEDVRGATRAVEARLAPGECIFAPTVWQIVAHYQATDAPLHYIYREPAGMMDRQLDSLYTECSSFWYLRARPWVDDADGRVLAAIESRYRRDDEMSFPGVTAIHFVRKN